MTAHPLSKPARIVLTTFGSLGDLHPYLALAVGLQKRGHHATVATSEAYRPKVEALGLSFHPVRPDMPDIEANPDLMRRVMGLHTGPEVVIRELAIPALRDSYEDIDAAAARADLLVSHPLTFSTRLVAEKKGLPWVSVALAPLSFFSAYDPPVLPRMTALARFRWLGPTFYRGLFALIRQKVKPWLEPWHHFRTDLGLPAVPENPLLEGQFSPHLTLALFSPLLGARQFDWPRNTVITGFPFHDQKAEAPADLARFLDAGPPPIVFTLGSAAVHDAGPFYDHAARAAVRLGTRAVLLVGNNRPTRLPDGVIAVDYAPFSAVFPRAAALVHQGGVGTTAEAMRAGVPMLVMPYAHDQPDNAERVARLGAARVVPRARFTADRATAELRRLLRVPAYARQAGAVGRRVRAEDGVGAACAALEGLLAGRGVGG